MRTASRRRFLGGVGASAAAMFLPQGQRAGAEDSSALQIGGAPVQLSIAVISARTIRLSILDTRLHLSPNEAFRHKGLLDKTWPAAEHNFTSVRGDEVFRAGELTISLRRSPLRVRVESRAQHLSQEIAFDSANGELRFSLGGRPVFGLGEGGHQFDRRGVLDTLVNGQNKPALFTTGGRNPIPWLISPDGWGIYFHHPLGAVDLRNSEGIFRPLEPPQPQDLFIVLASEPSDLLHEFALLTGLPHLPPLWAFGYHQSHRTLNSRDEVLAEARTFREKKLPCDSLIYLGTGYAPSGWNQGHGSFAFNEKIFPDPKEMFAELHGEHFHVTLHVLNPPQDLHGTLKDGPSNDPDAVVNYWPQHVPVMRTGTDGWWVDDGDELPAELRLTRNRLYWDGPRTLRPNVRPFALHRNSYAGSAMYGWLWSGDTRSTWETLRAHVAVGMNASLSGIPWWGSDTGGFFSTPELSAELYVRWFQFSAFCTLFRSHGRTWKLRLPWGWNTGEYGPVEDPANMLPPREELHHPEVEEICRKYLELRYRLLPYIYSMAYLCHTTGVPVMRPLWLHAPADARACQIADQFFWGRDLIVAPVLEKGARTRAIYLPKGTWYDFWTEEVLEGGREYTCNVDLATLPLFVRAGALLPLDPVKQFTGQMIEAPLSLTIYPDADGAFTLYEDDGVSFNFERGLRSRTKITWSKSERKFAIGMTDGDRPHAFTTRRYRVRIAGTKEERDLEFHGNNLTIRL